MGKSSCPLRGGSERSWLWLSFQNISLSQLLLSCQPGKFWRRCWSTVPRGPCYMAQNSGRSPPGVGGGGEAQSPGPQSRGTFAGRQTLPQAPKLGVLGHSACMPHPHLHLQTFQLEGARGEPRPRPAKPCPHPALAACLALSGEHVHGSDLHRPHPETGAQPATVCRRSRRSRCGGQDPGARELGILGSPTRAIFLDSCGFEKGRAWQTPT